MINDIGASAVRSLSVDVANLSARLAVQTAILENLMQLATEIDSSSWKAIESSNGDDEDLVGIPMDQGNQLQALLSALSSVQ